MGLTLGIPLALGLRGEQLGKKNKIILNFLLLYYYLFYFQFFLNIKCFCTSCYYFLNFQVKCIADIPHSFHEYIFQKFLRRGLVDEASSSLAGTQLSQKVEMIVRYQLKSEALDLLMKLKLSATDDDGNNTTTTASSLFGKDKNLHRYYSVSQSGTQSPSYILILLLYILQNGFFFIKIIIITIMYNNNV